jgi:hypothetical protein
MKTELGLALPVPATPLGAYRVKDTVNLLSLSGML